MFHVNDVVVYGSQGVCEIVGIEDHKIDSEIKQYFVLKPKSDKTATFFIPTWNEKALSKMRKVMSKEAVDRLIDSMPYKEPIWITNDNERREIYKKILSGGEHAEIIAMVQALFLHKKQREAHGKRLHISDEHFLKDAEQLLYHEWEYVLNLDKAGLMKYIFDRIERK